MATPPRIYEITFTVPAGTQPSAPFDAPWVTEDNTIVDIELEVPPGHNGLTGVRVVKGDTQLLPWGNNTWIIANNYSRIFPVGAYIPTGDLTLEGYNTGAYPHSFYLRMTVTDFDQQTGAVTSPLTSGLPVDTSSIAPDPLSPDAIIGADTASALTSGTITASDVTPIISSDLVIPPMPTPSGLG